MSSNLLHNLYVGAAILLHATNSRLKVRVGNFQIAAVAQNNLPDFLRHAVGNVDIHAAVTDAVISALLTEFDGDLSDISDISGSVFAYMEDSP